MLFKDVKKDFKFYSITLICTFAIGMFYALILLIGLKFRNIDFSHHSIRLYSVITVITMYNVFFAMIGCYFIYNLNKKTSSIYKKIEIGLIIILFPGLMLLLLFLGLNENWNVILIIATLILLNYIVLIIRRLKVKEKVL